MRRSIFGDAAGGAERPAGSHGLARHGELLCRRFLVEKSASARDQMARGMRLDEAVSGDAGMARRSTRDNARVA